MRSPRSRMFVLARPPHSILGNTYMRETRLYNENLFNKYGVSLDFVGGMHYLVLVGNNAYNTIGDSSGLLRRFNRGRLYHP